MKNEASKDLKDALMEADIEYQFVPSHNYMTNLYERAIQTFKWYFKAGLVSLDLDFTIREWDRIVEQGELTLNLLRVVKSNPKSSDYEYSFGQLDYSATPLVSPGKKQ